MTTDDQSPYLFGSAPRDRLRMLLLRAGWTQQGEVSEAYSIWKPRERMALEVQGIVVPLDASRGDYDALYQDALTDIRRILGDDRFKRLTSELDREDADDLAQTVWRRHARTEPGTIPWLDGQEVHAAIARQLMASAKAVVSPRARLGRSNEYVAREFLAATVLAPSGVGSYVVNALTPIHRPIYLSAPPAQEKKPTPQPRESIEAIVVLRRFDQALSAISSGLAERSVVSSVAMLAEQSRAGVSYELVSSLGAFLAGNEASIEVPRNSWEPDAAPNEYVFKPRHFEVLLRVAEALRGEEERTRRFSLTGVVTKLQHEPGSDDYVVRVVSTSRGPVRGVVLHVSEEHYGLAMTAHGDDSLIRVIGSLSKDKGRWTMRQLGAFEVLDGDEEDKRDFLFSPTD